MSVVVHGQRANNVTECIGKGLGRGKRIAYQSTEFNTVDIFVMNADGSDKVNMTVRPLSDDSPAWAPDGVRIAFVSHRDADAEIYVLGTQFSDLTRVTTAPRDDVTPAWSPDGTRIAFVSNRDFNPEIYVANADGTGQKRLTNDPGVGRQPCMVAGWQGHRLRINPQRATRHLHDQA